MLLRIGKALGKEYTIKVTVIATLMIFLAYFLVLYGSVAVYAFVSEGGSTSAPQSPSSVACGAFGLLVGIPQVITHFIDDPLDLTGVARLTIML